MLLRLHAVEEIGRFAKLRHKGQQLDKLSLVFARNGYGKSTLCAVLRSASEDQPNHIHARRRLTAKTESRVQLSWACGTTFSFSGGKWSASPGKVHVFDQEFIHENLYVGESITRDNKRNLLPLVLGTKGVELAQKITALDIEQRNLDIVMRAQSGIIQAKCPIVSQNELLDFCSREIPQNIQIRLIESARTVELAKQSIVIKQKSDPKIFQIKEIDFYREIGLRTITSVSEDTAHRVQSHIINHQLEPHGDRWLKYGIEHSHTDQCPFCDQSIAGLSLISAYQAYFSEGFARLIADRDGAIASLLEIGNPEYIKSILDSNQADFTFWNSVCDIEVPSLSMDEREIINIGLNALRKILEKKVTNPLIATPFGVSDTNIEAAFVLINNYNKAVEKCATTIAEARGAAQNIDLNQVKLLHQKWLAIAEKESDPIKSASQEYIRASSRRKSIEGEKKTAQNDLLLYAKQTVGARQTEINRLLENFGANFKIVDAKANFVGREPNTEFAVEIDGAKVKLGEKLDTKPSFKTVLSAGDKTTLALAFFVAQVRADPKVDSAVVVFDDPFNSQDMGRQFETTAEIRSIADTACQTVVFSHDPRFLHAIEKDSDSSTTKTFQLLCTDNGEGEIAPWSSADELEDLYVRQSEMIRQLANHGTLLKGVTHLSIVQAIRPFLESYIRARFPGRFNNKDQIFDMSNAIEQAGADDPLHDSVADLIKLNEYTRPYMHGGSDKPNPVDLRTQCRKIVKIVGKY